MKVTDKHSASSYLTCTAYSEASFFELEFYWSSSTWWCYKWEQVFLLTYTTVAVQIIRKLAESLHIDAIGRPHGYY